MATTKARKDSDVVREMKIDKLGTVKTWTLTHKTVKNLSAKQAADFEAGFAARACHVNQGTEPTDAVLTAFGHPIAWLKGYEFARSQESAE